MFSCCYKSDVFIVGGEGGMSDAENDISSKNNCHADSPEMSCENIRKRSRSVEGILCGFKICLHLKQNWRV
jgi:hypothetical protein